MPCIAIDVMGGEHGPSVTVSAALQALRQHRDLELLLVGDRQLIDPCTRHAGRDLMRRIEVRHTAAVVTDRDRPESVLRNRESSMFLAVQAVEKREAAACVSAGNSGALLLVSRHLLGMLPGIDRPAFVAAIPAFSESKRSLLLDAGATLHVDGEQLYQFGIMGAVLAASLGLMPSGASRPRVGLLNIGTEDYKGSRQIHTAARLLEQAHDTLEYAGFIEANRVFEGDADVLVCDGFSGNITIKASAGTVRAIEQMIAATVKRFPLRALLSAPLLRSIRRQADPAQYNGASLLGLRGVVVKSHGHAGAEGFCYAVEHGMREAGNEVPELIADAAARLFAPPDGQKPVPDEASSTNP